ncbi:MAG: hypothetical protein PHW60_15460 [Kiritimatiellae bacterium]|nr:hypothetical protein [Kiritimatiellia bacterium]
MKQQAACFGLARVACIFAALAIALPSARAATTWTGGTGDWSVDVNWSDGVSGDGTFS